MSKTFEVMIDQKKDEEELELLEAEREFISKRNTEVENSVTKYTQLMVGAQLRGKPIMARWYQKKIQDIIPNYDEYRQEAAYYS